MVKNSGIFMKRALQIRSQNEVQHSIRFQSYVKAFNYFRRDAAGLDLCFEGQRFYRPTSTSGSTTCGGESFAKRPGLELDRWVKTSRRAKRMSVVNVVYEVMPQPSQLGGRDQPFIKPTQNSELNAAMKRLRQQLRCDGYTVNGDMTVWHLYAIELTPFAMSRVRQLAIFTLGRRVSHWKIVFGNIVKGITIQRVSGCIVLPAISDLCGLAF